MYQLAPAPTVEFKLSRVVSVTPNGIEKTFDISVHTVHEFFANKINVHNCMGLYHPHGDSGIFSGLVTMVNQPYPPVKGIGNWGSMMEDAGAMRYVNCHLSKYADLTMFDKAYTPVMDLMPNYDEKEVEAVLLPCLLPNLLLNGASGIAVAATCTIPPFKLEGIIALVDKALGGKTITPADCASSLHLNYTYGGTEYLGAKEYKDEWLNYFKTGVGSILVSPEYRFNAKTRTMRIYGFPPGVNLYKVIEELYEWPTIDKAYESTDVHSTDKCTVDVILKPFKPTDKDIIITAVVEAFERMVHLKTNVTVRDYIEGVVTTKFRSTTVPDILNEWVKRRILLETSSLSYAAQQLKVKIAKTELLIFAVDNRKVILACLDAKDVDKELSTKLKISLDDAKQILDLQIRKLSTMDKTQLQATLKQLQLDLKQNSLWLKKPAEKVRVDLKALAIQLED